MRPILSSDEIHDEIHDKIHNYNSDIVSEVKQAVQDNRIVVVGMRWNNSVRKARANLRAAGLAFTYLEYGSYTTGWYRRLSLKMWTGFSTFPMVFVDQALIGGNAELEALLAKKSL